MKNEEAIEWLRAISATQGGSLHSNSLPLRREALYIAIQAIRENEELKEKQIPKKPLNKQGMKDFHGRIYAFRGNCARCRLEVGLSISENYCPNCGPAIDWSEEDTNG